MTNSSSQELFRQAAEAEGGMSVSAGARVAQVRKAVESGRAMYVDLSAVPEEKRPALVAAIKDLVIRASIESAKTGQPPVPDASNRPS
jgi:hypothetical protein